MMNSTQLKWHCRRGMKELDILLYHYLEHHYQQASLKEQQHFQTLLTYSDHQLYAYLIAHQQVLDPELEHLIKKIKRFKG